MGVVFDGKKEASKIIELLKREVAVIAANLGRRPKLVVIRVLDDDASRLFVAQKKKVAREIGVEAVELWLKRKPFLVKNVLDELNKDKGIDGYLLQLPVKGINQEVWDYFDISKDVEGLGSANFGRLISGGQVVIPPTVLSVLHAISNALGQKMDILDLSGMTVCVVSSSRLIGLPLFILLVQKGATVTMCHEKTKDLSYHVRNSDIIVSGTGIPGIITPNMVTPKSIVIDLGTKVVCDDRKGCIIKGDVDFEAVSKKVAFITPPTGGVGPLVVSYLFKNLITLIKVGTLIKNTEKIQKLRKTP